MANELETNELGITVNVSDGGSWVIDNTGFIDNSMSEPIKMEMTGHLIPDNQTGTPVTVAVSPQGTYVINGIETALAFNGYPSPLVTLSASDTYVINYVDTGIPLTHQMLGSAELTVGDNGNWLVNGQDSLISSFETGTDISVDLSPEGWVFINGRSTHVNLSGERATVDSDSPILAATDIESSWEEEPVVFDEQEESAAVDWAEEPASVEWQEEVSVDGMADLGTEEAYQEPLASLATSQAAQEEEVVVSQALSQPPLSAVTVSEDYPFLPIKTFTQMASTAKGVSHSGRRQGASSKSATAKEPNFINMTTIAKLGLGSGLVLSKGNG